MSDITQALDRARRNLLDLGLRNRLLNFRLDGKRALRVFDAVADQVYDVLVRQSKPMKFAPASADDPGAEQLTLDDAEAALGQPEDSASNGGIEKQQSDQYLQTKLASDSLQTRLLRIETEAQTAMDEQGINILYLAAGFVSWYDRADSDEVRHAPLILIPATLTRESAGSRYKLMWSEEDIATNESLAVKLKSEFGVDLPRLPEDSEHFRPSVYFDQVRRAIEMQKRWEVMQEVALGFFTFAKLLMWRDLDRGAWPDQCSPDQHPVIGAILQSTQLARTIHEPGVGVADAGS